MENWAISPPEEESQTKILHGRRGSQNDWSLAPVVLCAKEERRGRERCVLDRYNLSYMIQWLVPTSCLKLSNAIHDWQKVHIRHVKMLALDGHYSVREF
uniref:Uncharacterized protein n=1 Tax=Hyaloperonospora arabidopsidis (strain Emoy2) TaxID=559515 RepID=M4BSD7_HYAAE